MMMINTTGFKWRIFSSVVMLLIGVVSQVDGLFVRSRSRRRLILVKEDTNGKNQHFNEVSPSDEIFDDYARDFVHSKGR